MRVKLMTLRYSATLGGFDDTPLLDFIRDKEVVAFREYFFRVSDVPHLGCIITYQDAVVAQETLEAAREVQAAAAERRGGGRRWNENRRDRAAALPEPERVLFNSLREWRSGVARKEGVPAYLIFRDRDLLEIIARRPDSRTALLNIPHVGLSKVERYGGAILAILQASGTAAAAAKTAGTHQSPPAPAAPCEDVTAAGVPA